MDGAGGRPDLFAVIAGESVALMIVALVIVCGVFIHPAAAEDKKIYDYNYQATKDAIAAAMQGKPSAKEMIDGKDKAAHPFRGF